MQGEGALLFPGCETGGKGGSRSTGEEAGAQRGGMPHLRPHSGEAAEAGFESRQSASELVASCLRHTRDSWEAGTWALRPSLGGVCRMSGGMNGE